VTDPFDVINKMSGGDPPPTSQPRADFDAAVLFGDAVAVGKNGKKPDDSAQRTKPPAPAETSAGSDEDEQDRLPLRETDLDIPRLEVLWRFIEGWRETFPAITGAFPPCWVRHRALRQEALALAITWQLVEWRKLAPTTWLDELERSAHRCTSWWSLGCDGEYHRADEDVTAITAASRAWLDQERTEREQRQKTAPASPAPSASAPLRERATAQSPGASGGTTPR